MSQQPENQSISPLDAATARRLRQLDALPVDTSALDRALQRQISRPGVGWWQGHARLVRAAAASVLVGLVLAGVLLMSTLSGSVQAEAVQMARVHHDLVNGVIPVTQVDSIESANRVLLAESPQAPALPNIPMEQQMACCMKEVQDKKMACLLMKSQDIPITMVVAKAKDMKPPQGGNIVRDGAHYYIQSVENLNMVTTQRQDRWVCLMGQVPVEQLVELARRLQF